jgi:hypothetical protein
VRLSNNRIGLVTFEEHCMKMKVKNWFEDNWGSIPIIVALVLLAVFLSKNSEVFPYLVSYGIFALTAVYAWATTKIARENKRTIEEMKQSRLDAVKPNFSLQPGGFMEDGDFGELHLINSGGTARDVNIDIETTKPKSTKLLFATAIEREHWVYILPITKAQEQTEVITVRLQFRDGYNRPHNDSLSINLADLRKEGRKIIGRYSELVQIKQTLESLKKEIRQRNK